MFRQASTKLLVLGLLFTTLNAQVVTQKYAQGKLFMKNGMTIEGKDMQMTMENVTIVVMDIPQVFPLSDVSQVMAKQGKAKKYGRNCAGVCVGLNLFSLLMTSGVTMEDEYGNEVEGTDPMISLIGTALWGGISYGIGYFIGQVGDDWEIVYFNRG